VAYKVFLVEDEITTREGIRDNVDWKSAGFEFCGEAPDGEIALPLIEATQPDLLITDIKMPFMDGLQLCKIIREHLPWTKIIIISGYDDFSYAQSAIKLGVTEYLLKPIGVQEMQQVLTKIASALDQEKSDRAYMKQLRSQVEDNLSLLKEKFLLRLVSGGESSISAIEQSQQMGINLVSRFYQVVLIKISNAANAKPFDYISSQQVEKWILEPISANQDILFFKKDIDEFVLIFKGNNLEELEQESAFLADLIQKDVESKAAYRLVIGIGGAQQRLGDLHRSYSEALVKVRAESENYDISEMQTLERAAVINYLEKGNAENFDSFFDAYFRPLGEAALRSDLLKHYIIIDTIFTAAQYISEMGGDVDQLIPEIHRGIEFLDTVKTLNEIRTETKKPLIAALAYRDSQLNNDRATSINQAKTYINSHFSDSNLSLNEVAAQVNFSPNHFSAVFASETGENFRDYLSRIRVEQAKKLLRITNLKCAEVALRCGYNDPHYFSIIFRKNTGLPPQKFRALAKKKS